MPVLLGGLLCAPHAGGHGTPHSQVYALTGNMFPPGCIFWGPVGLHIPRVRAAGHITRLVLWSLPCISRMWGLGGCKGDGSSCIYGFGHSTARPCAICGHRGWGPNRQGQGLPGSIPASPRGPKFLPRGPPHCHGCVLRGALPAHSPPEIFWGGLPCAGVCYSGGGGGNVQQDRESAVSPAMGPATSGWVGWLWVPVLAEGPASRSGCGCLGGAGHGAPS